MDAYFYPDGTCCCNSGLDYVACHQPILQADDASLLDVAQTEYAKRWAGNASAYEAQGVYDWLADQLASFGMPHRVVDIGCGRGEGLAALQRRIGANLAILVGIDENPGCLTAAAARLVVSPPARRLRRAQGEGRTYDLAIEEDLLPKLAPVMLAQVDTLRPDEEYEAWIMSLGPFDAITMWFTGVHPARQFDVIAQTLEIGSDRVHRLANDLAALDLAGAALRPDGVLQIAGRGRANVPDGALEPFKKEMHALAAHGPFEVVAFDARRYDEPATGLRVGLGVPDGRDNYALSALFRRL